MLQTEVDETMRQMIKRILNEFETKLASQTAAPLTHVNHQSSQDRDF